MLIALHWDECFYFTARVLFCQEKNAGNLLILKGACGRIFAPAKVGIFPHQAATSRVATSCANHCEYSLCPCAAVER